jgi:hypothetical protein
VDGWLAAIVLGHLFVTLIHGAAHNGGHVGLSFGSNLFVLLVIVAAPLVGLAVAFRAPRLGGSIVAASMAAALLFGLVNHFIIISPDHVSQVAAEWRGSFTATAVLLIVTEAAGVAVGLGSASRASGPLEERT